MKNIFNLAIAVLLFSTSAISQKNIDQVLRKYKNDEGVMNMSFSGDLLKSLSGTKEDLKSKIETVDVIVFDNGQNIDKADEVKIKAVLNRDKFDLLIDVKNKQNKVQVYATESGQYLDKVFAFVNSKELNAYFILSGKIVFEELSKLNLDFKGEDPLKILNRD